MNGWLTILLIIIAVELAVIWTTLNVVHTHMHELLDTDQRIGFKE